MFKKLATDSAEYRIGFPQADIQITLQVTVGEAAVELRVTDVKENGPVKLKTLFFPGNALMTVRSSQPDVAMAATHATCIADNYQGTFRERIGTIVSMAAGTDTGNYLFVSTGKLAAGIADNNPVDIQRTAWKITEKDGVKTCTAWCPAWIYREIDSETVELALGEGVRHRRPQRRRQGRLAGRRAGLSRDHAQAVRQRVRAHDGRREHRHELRQRRAAAVPAHPRRDQEMLSGHRRHSASRSSSRASRRKVTTAPTPTTAATTTSAPAG